MNKQTKSSDALWDSFLAEKDREYQALFDLCYTQAKLLDAVINENGNLHKPADFDTLHNEIQRLHRELNAARLRQQALFSDIEQEGEQPIPVFLQGGRMPS